jgi:nicotinamide-nucleotide amidase
MEDIAADFVLLSAEILSIGSELTVGDTRDTNASELARSLTAEGVTVRRITAIPDRLDVVAEAFSIGLDRADLVVSTGGLGPTPDDLTREAIARVCSETPEVDPVLERWLRGLWARRGHVFPELNRKQAWRIPSATALANPNGTAPGWDVARPDGRRIVALPGPPREMRPMWTDLALPRLRSSGLGRDVAAITFRLTGIGESQVAEILGEPLLRQGNPEVATYARAEAVDVRVSAEGVDGRSAASLVDETAAIVRDRLGRYIWATGATTWADAVGAALAARGWRLALTESGTRGAVAALFGGVDWVVRAESVADERADALAASALRVRAVSGAEVGLAVHAEPGDTDTMVRIAVISPQGTSEDSRTAFLTGSYGRSRAALAAAAVLLGALSRGDDAGSPD